MTHDTPNRSLRTWLGIWRLLGAYHRYSVHGFEYLQGGEPALVIGYHGRPWAWDMCMLMVEVYDRLGYYPHGFVHRGVDDIPLLGGFAKALGSFTGKSDPRLAEGIAAGHHIFTTPGGSREACRSFLDNYQVDWGCNVGYLELALEYDLHIVPVAAAGADDTYIGLNNPIELARFLGLPPDWAWLPWLGVGPLGFFPFSPPFPVQLRQLVGAPIDPRALGARQDDRKSLLRAHAQVVDAVQTLLNRARHEAYAESRPT
jgi:hypothetical protein